MSDTRTDREALAAVIEPRAWLDSALYGIYASLRRESLATADRILASDFRRIRPPKPLPPTIAVPHTPEEIWAAADVWCDLDFWDKGDLEYTPDGVLHLASNVNITPLPSHMPDKLRPDIGEDRVDGD